MYGLFSMTRCPARRIGDGACPEVNGGGYECRSVCGSSRVREDADDKTGPDSVCGIERLEGSEV